MITPGLKIVALFFILSGLVAAIMIAFDLRRHPQPMKIMNPVWILTGLWGSILALTAYYAFGRALQTKKPMNMPMAGMKMESRPHWQSITLSALHCGAGCTLADIMGEWFLYFIPVTLFGSVVVGGWIFDYILALITGIVFQYAAIQSMNRISPKKAILKAFKADVLSLTSWQIGMYGWMAMARFVIFPDVHLAPVTPLFWFMMQLAMLAGFICAFPMNALLIHWGIKKAM